MRYCLGHYVIKGIQYKLVISHLFGVLLGHSASVLPRFLPGQFVVIKLTHVFVTGIYTHAHVHIDNTHTGTLKCGTCWRQVLQVHHAGKQADNPKREAQRRIGIGTERAGELCVRRREGGRGVGRWLLRYLFAIVSSLSDQMSNIQESVHLFHFQISDLW